MPHQFVTIANFLTPEDAEVARIALLDEGITASLENATVVGMLWYYGNATGWVKLLVPATEERRAREVLTRHITAAEDEASARRCAKCGAQLPPRFEICWSCGSAVGEASQIAADSPSIAAPNLDDEANDAPPGDAMAWRAFCAATLGVFVCPPLLTFYSGWLVLRLAVSDNQLSRKGKRSFYWAMIIDVAVCLGVGLALSGL